MVPVLRGVRTESLLSVRDREDRNLSREGRTREVDNERRGEKCRSKEPSIENDDREEVEGEGGNE